ncbi:glycosyltransferase family 2 protein, partial [bacterium]|nr:glycosyltransferase family 2 protein [bacterium]
VIFDTNTLLVCSLAVLLGFMLITFAAFATTFAVSEGLLPEHTGKRTLMSRINLEVGIVLGGLITLAGLATLVGAVLYWSHRGFGDLPRGESVRIVVPAVTLITLGAHVFFASFFLSLLRLRRRK